MDGVFDGFVADGDTFTFPTGSESWAGVANTNNDLYPLSFPEGGEVLFRGARLRKPSHGLMRSTMTQRVQILVSLLSSRHQKVLMRLAGVSS